jgi:hypothetical protein
VWPGCLSCQTAIEETFHDLNTLFNRGSRREEALTSISFKK